MRRLTSPWHLALTLTLALVGTVAGPKPSSLQAADAAVIKVNETYEIDPVGNAAVKTTITAPTAGYTALKVGTPNVNLLLRKLGVGRGWAFLENADAKFNDVKSSIEITYTVRGFARVEQPRHWSMPIDKDAALDLVDSHDRTAIYQGVVSSAAGPINAVERVITPAGSKNLKNNPQTSTFSYEFEPKVVEGDRSDASFQVEAKDALMGCLAKCYSNERFGLLWVAKSRFENTGNTVLSDYRIRFRVAGFSDWSTWRHSAKVFPGQTVVDPFYPVFDLEKLGLLTGTRAANLEFEYQYKQRDGQIVTETDTKKLQLLGYNETIFTGLAPGEVTTLAESAEYLPYVLASFSAPNDPVVQQLVGRLSALVPNGANNAAGTNESATAFAKVLYEWMVANHISYQTPPAYVNGTNQGQHIKYARDVLRNRAGTCIDLAIFWSSACESVHLQTALVLTKSHCFPVIRLPQGGFLAVEATGIAGHSFDEAVKAGTKEVEMYKDRPDLATFVDVLQYRLSGVQPTDLPKVSDTFLTDLGYDFTPRKALPVANQPVGNQPVANQNGQKPATDNAKRPVTETTGQRPATDANAPADPANGRSPFVGDWLGALNGEFGGAVRGTLHLKADGQMSFSIAAQYQNGETRQFEGNGQWKTNDHMLVLTDQAGLMYCPFQFKSGQLALFVPRVGVEINFVRSQG